MYSISLSIVIAAYNEESNIQKIIDRCIILRQYFKDLEIVVVNDGSMDSTGEIVKKLCEQTPGLILLNLAVNSGHMAAISAGLEKATGDWIATIDADGQDDPKHILSMYEACLKSNSDICLTQRINRKNDSYLHRVFSPIFYKLLYVASNKKIVYQSADFRLISKRVQKVLLDLQKSIKCSGF